MLQVSDGCVGDATVLKSTAVRTSRECSMGIMRRRMRRRLIVGGAAAGAVAYHEGKKHGRRAEQDDQSAEAEQETEYAPAPPADTGPDAGDLDQIEKLAKLHESGALTDEEFSSAKAKLLA
jgi:putative oligomerization/nucleic acid binding protein